MGDGFTHMRKAWSDNEWFEHAMNSEIADFILLVKEDSSTWEKKDLLDRLTDLCSMVEINNFDIWTSDGAFREYKLLIRTNGATRAFSNIALIDVLQEGLLFAEFLNTDKGKEIYQKYMRM